MPIVQTEKEGQITTEHHESAGTAAVEASYPKEVAEAVRRSLSPEAAERFYKALEEVMSERKQ